MRILQINAVYGIMSTGRNTQQISAFLRSQGHECISFYGESRGNYENTVFMGSDLSHKVHAISARLTGEAGIGSWSATRRLISFIKEYNPDVVHLQNLHGNFVHIPMLLRYLADADVPTVISLHDCFFFTGGCMHYTSNQCFKWLDNCENCQYLRRGKNYIFSNRAGHNLQRKKDLFNAIPRLAVCGVSQWTENEARRSPVFANAKIITHVYNWIDLETFKPLSSEENTAIKRRLGASNQPMILGVSSGWGASKGLDDFSKLATRLPNVKIVLVGKMPENVDLAPNIIAVGSTENVDQLAQLYSAADVFVHLSKEESFGKVIAEALACGTPAVVYNSTAMPEIVDDATGRVVEPGNINGVATAIHEVLESPFMADACRNRATELFEMSRNLYTQTEIYKRISK